MFSGFAEHSKSDSMIGGGRGTEWHATLHVVRAYHQGPRSSQAAEEHHEKPSVAILKGALEQSNQRCPVRPECGEAARQEACPGECPGCSRALFAPDRLWMRLLAWLRGMTFVRLAHSCGDAANFANNSAEKCNFTAW